MRSDLSTHVGQQFRFKAYVKRFSKRKVYKKKPRKKQKIRLLPTVLLTQIESFDGNIKVDHCWVRTPGTKLKKGDLIHFDAKVNLYVKGYQGKRLEHILTGKPVSLDYELTKIKNIEVNNDEKEDNLSS